MVERLHDDRALPPQQTVDDERRCIADENGRLAELLRHRPDRCERGVVRVRRPRELDERQDRDRVEEVHPDDALGVLELGAHLGHRERRRIRREDALGRDDSLELREHLLLDRHLLEDRLEDEIATGEHLPLGAAGDERAQEPRLALAETLPAHEVGELVGDPRDRIVDLLLGEVAQHDRHLEAAEHEQRELAGHEAGADDADSVDPPRLGVRHADAALRAALHEVERIDGGLRLRSGEELRERVLLGSIALLERPRRGALDQVERAVRRGSRAVYLPVEARTGLPAHLGDVGEIRTRPPLAGALVDLLEQERERLVEELDRFEERVGEAWPRPPAAP